MYDIRKLNIWKKKENETEKRNAFLQTDIMELNLSVRSFNCLKRANCHTVGDILALLDEEGNGLRNLRNLGSRSEKEILEAIKKYREDWSDGCKNLHSSIDEENEDVRMIRRKQMRSELGLWETDIEAFALSQYALTRLKQSGINKVKDLYATNPKSEPGWYAVRELFEKIV